MNPIFIQNIEKIFLSELGKGTYREVLTRIPGFGSGPDQVNNGFIIVLLENWSKRKKFSGQDLGEIFQKLNLFSVCHFLNLVQFVENLS